MALDACAAAGTTAATLDAPTATVAHAGNPPARQQPGLSKRHGPRACAREGLQSLGAAQRPARLPALGRLRVRGQAHLHAMPGVPGVVLVVALHALHLAVLFKGCLHVGAPAHHQLRARSDQGYTTARRWPAGANWHPSRPVYETSSPPSPQPLASLAASAHCRAVDGACASPIACGSSSAPSAAGERRPLTELNELVGDATSRVPRCCLSRLSSCCGLPRRHGQGASIHASLNPTLSSGAAHVEVQEDVAARALVVDGDALDERARGALEQALDGALHFGALHARSSAVAGMASPLSGS